MIKQRLKLIINYINLVSALLLVATTIFYYPVQKTAFFLFFISYFIEVFVEQKWKYIQFDKKTIYFLVLIFFFLLALVYFPFEHSTKYFSNLLVKRLSIPGFALVGIFGVNSKYKLNYFLNTLIISSVATIAYIVCIRIGIAEFVTNPLRSEIFTTSRILWVNSHMMFNFYLNISLVSIWYILTRSWSRTSWWKRYLYIGALSIDFGFLSISEGRSGFLAGILVMLCFIFFEIWKRKKAIGIIIGLCIPFLLVGVASHHRRMSEKNLEAEPRLFLWKSAISVVKESPVFGYGISDAQEHFDVARAKYQTEEFRLGWIDSPRLDSHSQYLQTTMEFGILGILTLLFIYIYPIFLADKNRKLFSILILFLCAYQSIFDMFITGQFAALFGMLVVLLLLVENNIAIDNQNEVVEE